MNSLKGHTRALAARTAEFLAARGIPAFVVGGSVRDCLLKNTTDDVDIVIDGSPHEIGPELAAALDGRLVSFDVPRDMIRIVNSSDSSRTDIDVARMVGDSILDDLRRRDFTVDAVAVEMGDALHGDCSLIDPLNGLDDIDSRTIRVVSDNVFKDDPVRMLRAVRISSETGFDIDPHTRTIIRRDSHLLQNSSAERLREELLKTLRTPGAGAAINLMDSLEVLSALIPELDAARGVDQPREHYYDVFGHLVAAVDYADRIVTSCYDTGFVADMMPGFEGIESYFAEDVTDGHTRGTLLKLTALLHDIAKPRTKTVEPSGRVRFFGHSEEGEQIAGRILKRLRFGRRGERLVCSMIRHHLRPRQMAGPGDLPTERAVFRYYRDLGDAALDTLYLNMADFLAARGPLLTADEMAVQSRVIAHILRVGPQRPRAKSSGRRGLLTGHDIMSELSLGPGPLVGRLLTAVAEAEVEGSVSTRTEALSLARKHLESGDYSG